MNTAATRQRRIMPITPPTVDEETSEKAAPVFLPSEIVEVLSDVLTPNKKKQEKENEASSRTSDKFNIINETLSERC